jgi:hypothetical protein
VHIDIAIYSDQSQTPFAAVISFILRLPHLKTDVSLFLILMFFVAISFKIHLFFIPSSLFLFLLLFLKLHYYFYLFISIIYYYYIFFCVVVVAE